jgi:undecaprenyl-diphosphatase
MNYLLQLDRSILVTINTDWTNSVFDIILPWIAHLADPSIVLLWIVSIGLLKVKQFAIAGKSTLSNLQKYKLYGQVVLCSCLFLSLIYAINAGLYLGIKQIVGRPRPFAQQHVMLRVNASDLISKGSFPSGHATNAFMVAAFFGACIKRKRFVFYGIAGLVALSRVYMGVHFPSDVLMGGFLGWSITQLMLFAERFVYQGYFDPAKLANNCSILGTGEKK